MAQVSDPLRFLNIKKKRQVNKQKASIIINNKQKVLEETSNFVLPSFSSLNSLEHELQNKIKKTYNPLKYFNPEIQEYLNKLQLLKIANSPVMPEIKAQKQSILKQNSQVSNQNKLSQNQKISMMTFSKNPDFSQAQICNQSKTSYSFFKPGLKKSGSMKMMQKMLLQGNSPNVETVNFSKMQVNPWQLPENEDQHMELKECQICGRKFNLKSYQKHAKVCQKVFFQKRKPFNSRSNSLDNKSTAK